MKLAKIQIVLLLNHKNITHRTTKSNGIFHQRILISLWFKI
jgi:hypothetical protein